MNNDPTYIKTDNGTLGEVTQQVSEYTKADIETMISALREQVTIWEARLEQANQLNVE